MISNSNPTSFPSSSSSSSSSSAPSSAAPSPTNIIKASSNSPDYSSSDSELKSFVEDFMTIEGIPYEKFDPNKPSLSPDLCGPTRSLEVLIKMAQSDGFDPNLLTDEEIVQLMISRQVSVYRLESILGKSNAKRCVDVRRLYYSRELELLDRIGQNQSLSANTAASESIKADAFELRSRADVLRRTQTEKFAYDKVVGACCENVIGCVRLPVGLVGPLKIDDQDIYVPLATTEGCLVASTSRGLSALAKSGGVYSRVHKDCMTRAPIVKFHDIELRDALNNRERALRWLQDSANKEKIKAAFRSTSKHTELIDYTLHPHGREIHIRFEARTGDAMGMNMCSKGAELALKEMQRVFPTMDILTISGNMCTDKKPSAINWTRGRGKSVECNALLPAEVVERVLKVSVDSLCEVWMKKVMLGSAMMGSIGGFNSHAANIVAAIFIATGQDAAQVVSSSNCLISLEKDSRGALAVHCTMPSIECGTVGGGTVLPDQSDNLKLMGIHGASRRQDRECDNDTNACKLAKIICATVLAAELSLLASLTEGTLVKSHMTHNRSTQPCKVV